MGSEDLVLSYSLVTGSLAMIRSCFHLCLLELQRVAEFFYADILGSTANLCPAEFFLHGKNSVRDGERQAKNHVEELKVNSCLMPSHVHLPFISQLQGIGDNNGLLDSPMG